MVGEVGAVTMVSNKAGLFHIFENESSIKTLTQLNLELNLLVDFDGRLVGVGEGVKDLLGYQSSEIIGRLYTDVFRKIVKFDDGLNIVECRKKDGRVVNYLERQITLEVNMGDRNYQLISLKPIELQINSEDNRVITLYKISNTISKLIFTKRDILELMKGVISIFSEIACDVSIKIIVTKEESLIAIYNSRDREINLAERQLIEDTNSTERKPCYSMLFNSEITNQRNIGSRNIFTCDLCEFQSSERVNVGLIPLSYEDELYGLICLSPIDSEKSLLFAEGLNLLRNIARDLGMAIRSIEIERKRKEALNKIKDNIEYFEYLADRLRNPLAIMQCSIDVREDIGIEKTFETLSEQIYRINKILEDLRKREIETFDLKERL